jgi:hypothetical protein
MVTMLVSSCGGNRGMDANSSDEQNEAKETPELVFREYEHNFGKVTEGEKIAYIFTFENTGPGDLVISNAVTSCGCTVSKYDTKPIPEGETGNLEVVFNTSGYNGMQTKTISVRSNAKTPVILLKIIAEIETNQNN